MTPRTAIVTGGSRGIGRAVCHRLAADGMSIVVGYSTQKDDAAAVVDEIRDAGGTAFAVGGDIGDETDVTRIFDEAESRLEGVDVVVNAAGLLETVPVAELDLDTLDRIFRTNVRGTFLLAREVAHRVRRGGAFVNFSSTVTRTHFPGFAAYAASKSAVETAVAIFAKELRGKDITVNAVAPGPTATELFFKGKDEATIERLRTMNPFERLGQPEDAADVVSFLAGDGRWINGQTVFANGGMA